MCINLSIAITGLFVPFYKLAIMITKNYLITAVVGCLLFSCTSSKVNQNRLDQGAFPPAFGESNHILLIEKRTKGINHNGLNNYIAKSFRKNYSGKFEMASYDEIKNNPKYADKKLYRFILTDEVWNSRTTVTTVNSTGSRSTDYQYVYVMDFHLYDRQEEKEYPAMGVGSNVPAKAINRTSSVLDKKLKQ